jgi:Holliday junction DNA helicase RuvB
MSQSALINGECMDHVLFSGPPGLGKTTVARILAEELGVKIHVTSGPALRNKSELMGMLLGLEENDILFIDEIHRLDMKVEENLYPAVEDGYCDLVIEGPDGQPMSIPMPLPPFTLVGATTLAGSITGALRTRFVQICRMQYYSGQELGQIAARSSEILDLNLTAQAANVIGERSRGTPRTVNQFVKMIRHHATVDRLDTVDSDYVNQVLWKMGVDTLGLNQLDRRYLTVLMTQFAGGPTGLTTLASALDESTETLQDTIEPYLLKKGLLQRTPRGRVITDDARHHLETVDTELV